VHRADGCQILVDHRFQGAPSFRNVALEAADQADVIRCVDENANIEEVAQFRLDKEQDTLHQDDGLGQDGARVSRPAVGGEVVDRLFNGQPVLQPPDVGDEQAGFQGVRMVKVGAAVLGAGDGLHVAVVGVVRKVGDVVAAGLFQQAGGHRALAGSCPAGNADSHRTMLVWVHGTRSIAQTGR